MTILITGAAGFIGFHLAKQQLNQGEQVVGLDNLNDYYEVSLKLARLEQLKTYPNFHFHELDISNSAALKQVFHQYKPQKVVHLAAQAGVRYSLTNPEAYVQSNLVGFSNIIELCRQEAVEHLVYASSSSVYGANTAQPYNESDSCNHPLSLYAATKKANELIAHSYSHLYQLPTTGLRFFTVYGPWGRPDMAFFSFTRQILAGKPIQVYNLGKMRRDFTYIDDIVNGLVAAINNKATPNPGFDAAKPDPACSHAPYKIFNIGFGNPVNLMDYIAALELALGKKAIIEFLPMQDGDVVSTHADTSLLEQDLGYCAKVSVEEGVSRFAEWYQQYYQLSK